ncbi:MAG: hypothetical protein C7B44_05870 [Sulfobacillus thermosulfidooxidans]|nr:MAG: hypothetical protein C7B44_05870 [Sulfobacillus thermosulfidooxidans]
MRERRWLCVLGVWFDHNHGLATKVLDKGLERLFDGIAWPLERMEPVLITEHLPKNGKDASWKPEKC